MTRISKKHSIRLRNAPLKGARAIGANMTEVEHGDLTILYSYKTPVAFLSPRGGYRTTKQWSVTTSKHISKFFSLHRYDFKGAFKIPQEDIEMFVATGEGPGDVRENPARQPQGGVHAYHVDHGRVWVESINSAKGTALIRYDPGEGLRSKAKSVPLSQVDFSREWKFNPPRRTKRRVHELQELKFFRAGSHAGMEKPTATAQEAKRLIDAVKWAHGQGVDYQYAYGADAGYEDAGDEWQGAVKAIHPNGTEAVAYGYLGNDYSQKHIKAEAALALKQEMGR